MKNNLMTAVFAGLATGALLGILFAEQKGTETRDELLADCDGWLNKLGFTSQKTEWDNGPAEEKAISN